MSAISKDSSTATVTSLWKEAAPCRALWGLFERKERWSLSCRGWLLLAFALVLTSVVVFRSVYSFLAITHRVDANVLVVEGWVHEYAIRAAVAEFRSGSYQRVFTTGGPVEGTGGYTNDYNTSASVAADLLRRAGVPDESLQMVPSRTMDWDRTYSSAIALREWMQEHQVSAKDVNVVTEDTHARRTWLLFQKALGKDVQVGIIAVTNPDYPANRWWHYSEGLKDVVSEFAAYLYARLFFWPSAVETQPDVRDQKSEVSNQKSEVRGKEKAVNRQLEILKH